MTDKKPGAMTAELLDHLRDIAFEKTTIERPVSKDLQQRLIATLDALRAENERLKESCVRKNKDGTSAYEWGYDMQRQRDALQAKLDAVVGALQQIKDEANQDREFHQRAATFDFYIETAHQALAAAEEKDHE